MAWLVDRYRYNRQIEARTAIHLRNFSNSYAESIRNLTKSFQNPGRKSQKLLQFLCRIYQKLHLIFPESRQNMAETSPNPMQNLAETSPNLPESNQNMSETSPNPMQNLAETSPNLPESNQNMSETSPNPMQNPCTRNLAKYSQRQPELCHFQLTAARSVSTDVQKAYIETDAVKHMQCRKVNNNTPVHIVDVLAEDFVGVCWGGYTANDQTCAFKTYTRHTQKSEKRVR